MDQVEKSLRESFRKMAKSSGLGHKEIADRVSKILNKEISLNAVDDWLSPTKEYRTMPHRYWPAFCEAVETDSELRWLNGPRLTRRVELEERLVEVREFMKTILESERKRRKR
jgi:hypothetical protein